ncbi:VRR-NUC domain-containing protein [Streptomyces sp. LHD-70]|uniref:VRR-NUC domain-containing protein n=1 Tax=Streptomyces sp. LHD-70 TaxID=3072140 RepID=UPI00280E5D27|nr:VRR-NUC domain-containing protein [Streptomyces sp. LHD-70]MDQ8706720.1 VRR-NUC domain-containing protein [Streptomyces sp. LHD-70]
MNPATRAEQQLYAKLLKERYGPLDQLEAERFPRETAPVTTERARGASEEQWRRQVREIAMRYGWRLQYHTADSRRSDAGWPDEVFGHVEQRRTVFVEFKTDSGRIRPAQRVWLTHLSDSGFEVGLWRPSDLHTVLRVLGPARQRANLPPSFRRRTS